MKIKQIISKHYLHIPKTLLKLFFTPRNIVVEPVAGCNVVCASCPQDILKRPYGKMPYENFIHILKKMKPKNVGLYFMGEPFLNREIFEMIEYAHNHGVRTVVNTNGSTLVKDYNRIVWSGLDKIAVSVDGYSQEVFEAYREGIDAEQVYLGLKKLKQAIDLYQSNLHIQVRTLAFENTMKELDQIYDALIIIGITDHRVIEPIITGWGGKQNPRLDKLGDKGRVKDTKPKICPSLFRMAVTWDGWLLPCCNDVHGENKFGNIYHDYYNDLMWGSDMWRRKANREFEICNHCYEDDQ